jgi:hypothetical protein
MLTRRSLLKLGALAAIWNWGGLRAPPKPPTGLRGHKPATGRR